MRTRVRLLTGSGILLTMLGIGACERATTVVSPAQPAATAEPAAVDPATGLLLTQLESAPRSVAPADGAVPVRPAVAASSATGSPSATLLTFEDLPDGSSATSMASVNPYQGVTFSTWSGCAWYEWNSATYGQTHSGEHYLLNGGGCDGESMAFGGPVYFGGAWVASPQVATAAPELWFEGYRNGALVGASPHATLQIRVMQYLAADFPGAVDSVVVRRTLSAASGSRAFVIMDDVCFGSAPVTADCELAPNSNSSPVASVGGPYTGLEGGAVALQLGGSDADGDALTYTWDFGDGAGGTGDLPPTSHVYADNGVYTLTLSVSDGRGGTDTRTTTATIANVVPSVSLSGPAQIYSGQQAAFTGSFSDPGLLDAPWHEAFDWGTGSPMMAQSATEGTLNGGPTYFTAGSYTVTLSVMDKDGGTGRATAALTVVRVPLGVDIKPGSSDNPLTLKGNGDASIAVAVLSSASFDASTVDVASVTLGSAAGGAGVARRKNGSYQASLEDVNGDGRADLLLHFDRQALIAGGWLTSSTTALTLLADLQGGVQVSGSDRVRIVR